MKTILTEWVGGAAHVDALILGADVGQIEGDVAKVVRLLDARTVLERLLVAEPLDAQRRIADGDQPALQVRVAALRYRVQVLQRRREHGSLERFQLQVDFLAVARSVLQLADLV